MQTRSIMLRARLVPGAAVLFSLLGCESLPLEDAPCPCNAGWICCAERCISDTKACESSAARRQRCDARTPCSAGLQCDRGLGYCVPPDEGRDGVFPGKLVFGMSAALDQKRVPGLAHFSLAFRDGVLSYFQHINDAGGIHGRKLELEALNDDYEVALVQHNVSTMIGGENRSVFALLGVIGTEPSLAARELVSEHRVLFVAPGTGDDRLDPEPPDAFVFNLRARWSEEALMLARELVEGRGVNVHPSNLAAVAQSDPSGSADAFSRHVVTGVGALMHEKNIDQNQLFTATVPQATVDVDPAIKDLLHWMAKEARSEHADADGIVRVGIVAGLLPDASALLVHKLSDQVARATHQAPLDEQRFGPFSVDELDRLARVRVRFAFSSATGAPVIGKLKTVGSMIAGPRGRSTSIYGAGTLLSSPMPGVDSAMKGIVQFREHLARYHARTQAESAREPNPFALEGYLAASLLGAALEKNGPKITTDSLRHTLEGLEVDLGIGTHLGFTPTNHQALSATWLTELDENLDPVPLGMVRMRQ